jgi:predicted O-linked N-acetylglucosamine transferase (SPINDLY family)
MIGYFDTTGLSAMNHRFTDSAQDPPGVSEAFHTEGLERLSGSCWCYRPDDAAPPVGPPPLERNGYVTFGCLNKPAKDTAAVARAWGGILTAVPRSRLLFRIVGGGEGGVVRAALAHRGVPPDRVDTPPKAAGRTDYLSRFGQVDLALDTFPFGGITTTCDGLWMGVPAVTLPGRTSVSRAGASIVGAAGLADLGARAVAC